MKVLLDTHAFLWWNIDSPQLSLKAKEIIADGSTEVHLSAASAWEIAIKYYKGRLILPESPDKYVISRMTHYHFIPLPIHMSHTLHTYHLPNLHNDPFDRLLVAQCQLEEMSIITADENISRYEVKVIW
jgi:PIN domain nuclease of toxin-antitoxin system